MDVVYRAGWWRIAQAQSLGFDTMQQVHDAAVFKPGLVVQKATQLLRQQSHRALRMLTRLHPVVVHTPQALVGRQLSHGRQRQHMLEQHRQLLLAGLRH